MATKKFVSLAHFGDEEKLCFFFFIHTFGKDEGCYELFWENLVKIWQRCWIFLTHFLIRSDKFSTHFSSFSHLIYRHICVCLLIEGITNTCIGAPIQLHNSRDKHAYGMLRMLDWSVRQSEEINVEHKSIMKAAVAPKTTIFCCFSYFCASLLKFSIFFFTCVCVKLFVCVWLEKSTKIFFSSFGKTKTKIKFRENSLIGEGEGELNSLSISFIFLAKDMQKKEEFHEFLISCEVL